MNEVDKDNTAIPAPATLHELAPDDITEALPAGADAPVLDDLAVVEELARLRTELDVSREQFLRQAAEFQNYRRRTDQEKTQSVSLGKTLVVQRLLDVVDDFGRSIDAAARVGDTPDPAALGDAFSSLRLGMALVFDKLRSELQKLGVEEMDVIGQPFNEEEHEALMQQPAPDGQAPGHVIGELQKGYRMADRVIRHAKVIVSV